MKVSVCLFVLTGCILRSLKCGAPLKREQITVVHVRIKRSVNNQLWDVLLFTRHVTDVLATRFYVLTNEDKVCIT